MIFCRSGRSPVKDCPTIEIATQMTILRRAGPRYGESRVHTEGRGS
jgi:hypothetical protein